MFKCYLGAVNLDNFLKLNDVEYVDMLLNKGNSFLISNSNEVFGCVAVKTDVSINWESIEIRVPVKILKNVSEGSYCYVEKESDGIHMTFYDSRNVKSVSAVFPMQSIFSEGYQHKLELILRLDDYDKAFNVKELARIVKVAKVSCGIISVKNGVVGSNLTGRGKVFYTPQDDNLKKQNFAVNAAAFSKLMRISNSVRSIENFLYAGAGGLSVLVTKCNSENNEEFAYMESAGAKFRYNVDLGFVSWFIKNMSLKVDSFELNAEQGIWSCEDNHVVYEIPFQVTDVEKSGDFLMDTVVIPMSLIKEISNGLGMNFNLEKKKNFIKLSKDGLIVYF